MQPQSHTARASAPPSPNPTAPACPSQTNCTNVEVIDSEHHRTTGLAPGQYACWNPISYAMCQRTNWQSKATLAGASFSLSCAA